MSEQLPTCKFLGRRIGSRVIPPMRRGDVVTKLPIFKCHHESHADTMLDHCEHCADYGPRNGSAVTLTLPRQPQADAVKGVSKQQRRRTSQDVLINRWGERVALGNAYANAHAFLVLSGPSLLENDLSKLRRRGVITMGVNNAPCVVACSMMTYVDSADKFHHNIYRDPNCMKFVPKQRLRIPTRVKNVDGSFERSSRVREFPNVIAYRRNAFFNPKDWLWENTINWGNSKNSAKSNGHPRDLNVMFAALRLLFYLGFRDVYLLGCDWNMTEDRPYSFGQVKHRGGVRSNNSKYATVCRMLSLLKPHFDAAEYRVHNCNPTSGLELYPHIGFDEAIERASLPDQLDASGWYDKYESKKGIETHGKKDEG